MFTTHTTVSLNSQFNMRWKQGERNCRLLRWFNKTQFLYQCVHPIHEATVFSIRMLLHFSDIVPRVCTSVLFIICTIFMPICVQIQIFCTHTCSCTHTRTHAHTHTRAHARIYNMHTVGERLPLYYKRFSSTRILHTALSLSLPSRSTSMLRIPMAQ